MPVLTDWRSHQSQSNNELLKCADPTIGRTWGKKWKVKQISRKSGFEFSSKITTFIASIESH